MVQRFLSFIHKEHLVSTGERVLLGISGGIDSMVMLHLFEKAGLQFSVAHCNFTLRESESDADQEFVENYSKKRNIEFFVKKFLTKEYAASQKISIQMAARELRTNWFLELLATHNFTSYATAHHLDDQVETLFINLFRGTGIAGLHGILPKQGKLIHPLLFTDRESIVQFAQTEIIKYHEDRSNKETKYQRNKIRHRLIPILKEINPHATHILSENIKRFKAAEEIYKKEINRAAKIFFKRQDSNLCTIEISKLQALDDAAATYLFEIISGFNFNYADAEDMIRSMASEPGKIFHSSTHRIIRDRDYFLIDKIKDPNKENYEYSIRMDDKKIDDPLNLSFEVIDISPEFKITPDRHFGYFDLHTLEFPLTLRKWVKGDFFFPLGLNHRKLLSDFFTDNKFSIPEKENTWLLASGKNIIWVVGHRIDNRHKVSDDTKRIFVVRILP